MKILFTLLTILFFSINSYAQQHNLGDKVDSLNGVFVYYNGEPYLASHGYNYAAGGYSFGQKWQCVEFVNRYYYYVMNFSFAAPLGHARDYWSLETNQGEKADKSGLYQFYNDDNEPPAVNDIIVFPFSAYGHVAIVSKITETTVEVIQQNIAKATRDTYNIVKKNGHYTVIKADGVTKPIGWLRKRKI